MKKKIHALLLTCLCMHPMQAEARFDDIFSSINFKDPYTAASIMGIIAGMYATYRMFDHLARKAFEAYGNSCGVQCTHFFIAPNDKIGVGASLPISLLHLRKSLEKQQANFTGITGKIMHTCMIARNELDILNNSEMKKLPYVSTHQAIIPPNCPQDATCQPGMIFSTLGFKTPQEKKKLLESYQESTIFLKNQISNAIALIDEKPQNKPSLCAIQ